MLPEATLVLPAPLGVQAGIEEIEVIPTPQGPMIRDNITGVDKPLTNPIRVFLEKIKAFFLETLDVAKGAVTRLELSVELALILGVGILAWNFSR